MRFLCTRLWLQAVLHYTVLAEQTTQQMQFNMSTSLFALGHQSTLYGQLILTGMEDSTFTDQVVQIVE